MPDFDTYHSIEDFAKHPNKPEAISAFRWLLHKTRTRISWDLFNKAPADGFDIAWSLYTGTAEKPKKPNKKEFDISELVKQPKEQRDKVFLSICKQVGVSIDPDALTKE